MDDVRDGLLYNEMHQWIKIDGNRAIFGMTDHAQHELGDIIYVSMPPIGNSFSIDDDLGAMESVKSIEEIYAPISGKIVDRNLLLEDSPQLVNTDPYGDGWMCAIELSDIEETESFMTPDKYRQFLK